MPTPIGHVANTPEIVAAFEAAVRTGWTSSTSPAAGPQTDPANDALIEAIANVAAAGVVPVISAGNDRDDFGFGTAGSPGTAPDAISVAAVSNTHVFAPALDAHSSGGTDALRAADPAARRHVRPRWATRTSRSSTSARSSDATAGRSTASSAARGADPNGAEHQLPAGLARRRDRARLARDVHVRLEGRRARKQAGAIGIVFVDNRAGRGERRFPLELPIPGGMISDLDGAALRAAPGRTAAARRSAIGRDARGPRRPAAAASITSFSSAGPTAFGHAEAGRLRARRPDPLVDAAASSGGSPFAVFDGTSMAAPHVAGRGRAARAAAPDLDAAAGEVGARLDGGPGVGRHARTQEAPVTLEGGGLVNVARADNPQIFTDPASLSFGDLDVTGGAARGDDARPVTDAGGGAGTWTVSSGRRRDAGTSIDVPAAGHGRRPAARSTCPSSRTRRRRRDAGENYGFVVLRRAPSRAGSRTSSSSTRPALAACPRPR